jgi:hypothetical protein
LSQSGGNGRNGAAGARNDQRQFKLSFTFLFVERSKRAMARLRLLMGEQWTNFLAVPSDERTDSALQG